VGLRTHPRDPWSPPLLVGGQRLVHRKAAECLGQHQRILHCESNTLRY
jgi:hypothetical protein